MTVLKNAGWALLAFVLLVVFAWGIAVTMASA